jgi:AAA+ ATPase superfamily predicted ATPase
VAIKQLIQMILKNPFSDFGGIIKGDRFVGRKSELNQIQKRLLGESFGNLAIIGLPRIGKSSLAWNSIIENKETLIQKKILPIWIPLGEFSNLIEFLDEVLSIVCDQIQTTNKESFLVFNELRNSFHSADSNLEKRRFVKKFLRNLNTNGFRLILVIDEFDNAQDIFSLQDFQFLRESSYNLETKIGIVTVSRKTIQELEPDNGSLSNFYQIFDELRLKLFSDEDVSLYWQRLKKLGISVSATYIENIIFYSGKHPYLLDLINYSIFNKIEQTAINLDEILNSTLETLKLKIYNEYESILKLMEQENLDKKLVQLIVGPNYDITQRDVEKLLKYSLVKSTTDESFECFAKFFEEYLSLKSSEIDIWPLWAETEIELRSVIKEFLIDKYGEDWVDNFVKGNPKKTKTIDELKFVMAKNIKSFGDKASTHLVDYTYPSHMMDCFIHSDWKWFENIFSKQFNDWKPKFDLLSEIRNPLAHNNREFLTPSKLNNAIGYCQEILTLIQKWKNNSQP